MYKFGKKKAVEQNQFHSTASIFLKIKNYFVSWIANLGVVPLFLLSAFLLEPLLALFASLTFLVTLVLDTINVPLYLKCFKLYETEFLPKLARNVKIFLISIIATHGATYSHRAYSITISEGGIGKVEILKGEKFMLGNKDLVSTKLVGNQIFIKAKKAGHTDITILGDKTKIIPLVILSRNEQLGLDKLKGQLQMIQIPSKYYGHQIASFGSIQDMGQYAALRSLQNIYKEQIQINSILSQSVRNQIIGDIYYRFFNENLDSINCNVETFVVDCEYLNSMAPHKNLIDDLSTKYAINWKSIQDENQFKNYKVRFKIFQMEKNDGSEINFGLDKLNANMSDVFEKGVIALIEKNEIMLRDSNLNISTLAEPELILRLNESNEIKIGNEVPFEERNSNGAKTIAWKFAGLKVVMKINKAGNSFKIDYTTEVSRFQGTNNDFSGSMQKSSAMVDLKDPISLFQIGFTTDEEYESGIPVLKEIPFLGNLFKSKSHINAHKKINALIQIEEI